MLLDSRTHVPKFFIGDTKMELANSLKILWVTFDNKLTYFEHMSNMLKKVYAKIGLLRRLKRLMPYNVSLSLYKAYLPPHLEYCSPLLIGKNRTLNSKLESANKYVVKTL